jgi:3-phosphoshikimate 1-carboxyvinyltransferase
VTESASIEGGLRLAGRLRVPGDKSVSHRALLLAALAHGRSRIRGLSPGQDVLHTAGAVRELGAPVEAVPGGGPGDLEVAGGDLREPSKVLYLGNSATGTRLLAGVVAPFAWLTVIEGDSSVNSRPMGRVAEPLRAMGARVDGREGGTLAPLVVRGGGLHGIRYSLPVASAQVKSAVLLAALGAEGATEVREALETRAHTEEMLEAFGADVAVEPSGLGRIVRVGPSKLQASEIEVPADPSQAAFWAVAGCICPGSDVVLEDLYVGPARGGFLEVLWRMGASLKLEPRSEHRADLVVRHSAMQGTEVTPEEVPGLIDEIPVLAVAGAYAEGTTVFRGAGELRVKESDRILSLAEGLRALGATVRVLPDGLEVEGARRLRGGRVGSSGDHRVAMAMAVAAMAAGGRTRVDGWEAVSSSYPGFLDDLAALSA